MTEKNLSEIAKALGKKGGLKRAQNMPKERRSEIAKMGAKKRWEMKKKS